MLSLVITPDVGALIKEHSGIGEVRITIGNKGKANIQELFIFS